MYYLREVVDEEEGVGEVGEAKRRVRRGELLVRDGGRGRVHARAAVLRRGRQAQQAQLAQLAEEGQVELKSKHREGGGETTGERDAQAFFPPVSWR